MIVRRVVTTPVAVEKVFDYLSDFTTTTQWDPGTVRTVLVRGGGGVGTEYANTSRLAGRTTELTYVVTRLRAPELVALRGENAAVVAEDTIAGGAGRRRHPGHLHRRVHLQGRVAARGAAPAPCVP